MNIGLVALPVLVLSISFAFERVAADSTDPVSIDSTNPMAKPYEARFTRRPTDIALEIKGDGENYRWVRVVAPTGLKIKVAGQPDGYDREEPIKPDVWYQFKSKLPLTVRVESGPEQGYLVTFAFGSLKKGFDPPKDPKEARTYRTDDKVEKDKGAVANLSLVDDTRPVLNVSSTELRFPRPAGKNGRAPEQTLEVSAINPAESTPTWTFVRFKSPSKDFDVRIADGADEQTTAQAGEQLEPGRFYGFTGPLRLVVKRKDFTNDDQITLSVEGGRAIQDVDTRAAALNAIENQKDMIRVKGDVIPVQLLTTTQDPGSSWVLIAAGFGVVVLAVLAVAVALSRRRRTSTTRARYSDTSDAYQDSYGAPAADYGYILPIATTRRRARNPISKMLSGISNWRPGSSARREAAQLEDEKRLEEERARQRKKAEEERGPLGKPAPIAPMAKSAISSATTPVSERSRVGAVVVPSRAAEEEVARLRLEMTNLGLTENAKSDVARLLKPLEEKIGTLDREISALRLKLEENQRASLERFKGQEASIAEAHRAAGLEFKIQLDSALDLLSADINATRATFEERFPMNERANPRPPSDGQHDRFYGALLGAIFGENVDPLRDDRSANSAREAAAALNQFFQEKIPRADVLNPLAEQAESMMASFKHAAVVISGINPQAEVEITKHVQSAKELVIELSAMQAQLRSRQVTLNAPVRIPLSAAEPAGAAGAYDSKLSLSVSAHSSARFSFLEELGFAIKREIDKLRDPHGHFRRQIERLATSDATAMADICDKQVAPPGKNSELEQSLQTLFANAGLRSILPRLGQPFRPAEQNLIQITSGGSPADSQKIAKVVSRGFYYNDGEKERLLRKAGVEVYR